MKVDIYHTGPLDVNTYVLKDEESKEAVIIDIGGDFDKIKSDLDEQGYNLNFILNTHGHFDHILGETDIADKYPDIPIYMHKGDLYYLTHIDDVLRMWGINASAKIINPAKFIDENDKLSIGNYDIRIIYTPGHSQGSLSYFADGKLFSGDALFRHSIGRTDLFGGDYNILIDSVKTKLLTLPGETIVYPGHGDSSTIDEEKKNNIYLTREND